MGSENDSLRYSSNVVCANGTKCLYWKRPAWRARARFHLSVATFTAMVAVSIPGNA